MPVDCNNCKFFIKGKAIQTDFSPPSLFERDQCFAPGNLIHDYAGPSGKQRSLPSVINRNGNCQWFEPKGDNTLRAEKEYFLPFTYKNLSKCFSESDMIFEENILNTETITHLYGGYKNEPLSNSQTNGKCFIQFYVPSSATDFSDINSLTLSLYGNSIEPTECKYDLSVYLLSEETGKTNIYTIVDQVIDSIDDPTHIVINKEDLLNNIGFSTEFNLATKNTRKIILEFTFYSTSTKYISMIGGSINLIS